MLPKNIIEYILQNTELTQAQIGQKLKPSPLRSRKTSKGIKYKETPVSQAVISKWKITGKIPEDRIDELLKIANIYWDLKASDEEYISSEHNNSIHQIVGVISNFKEEFNSVDWHMLVKTKQNQNDWYDIFAQELPTSINIWKDSDGNHSDTKFLAFVRKALLQIVKAGIELPASPLEFNSVGKTDIIFQDFIIDYRTQIEFLQSWCRDKIPEGTYRDMIYDVIPGMALAQCHDNPYIDELEMDIWEKYSSYAFKTFQFIENTIKEYERNLNNEIDPRENIHGYFDILKMKPDRGKYNFMTGEKIDSFSTKDQAIPANNTEPDLDKYLSYSERKIFEKLQEQEESIKNLQNKIDSLIKSLETKIFVETSTKK